MPDELQKQPSKWTGEELGIAILQVLLSAETRRPGFRVLKSIILETLGLPSLSSLEPAMAWLIENEFIEHAADKGSVITDKGLEYLRNHRSRQDDSANS